MVVEDSCPQWETFRDDDDPPWRVVSMFAAMALCIPSALLDFSVGPLIIGLGKYLGLMWLGVRKRDAQHLHLLPCRRCVWWIGMDRAVVSAGFGGLSCKALSGHDQPTRLHAYGVMHCIRRPSKIRQQRGPRQALAPSRRLNPAPRCCFNFIPLSVIASSSCLCFEHMDPLSIIGSVAGVATAGVSLVSVLFETVDTYRSAPKEIGTIARGIQDLGLVLDQLVQVLSDSRDMQTRRLRKSVVSTIQRIDNIHDEVWQLIDRGESSFGRVKWTLFLKGRMRDLVARIEAHKSTVQLVCTTLLLAMQQRRVAKSKEPGVAVSARRRLRRQAENLVNAAHESLRDLTERGPNNEDAGNEDFVPPLRATDNPAPPSTGTPATQEAEDNKPSLEAPQELRVSARREVGEEAALFLYSMVFSRTGAKDAHTQETGAPPDNSNALVIHNPGGTDIVLAGRPFVSRVVDDLLQSWTVLSDEEIDEVAETEREEGYQSGPARSQSGDSIRGPEDGRRASRRQQSPRSRPNLDREETQTDSNSREPPEKRYRPMFSGIQADEPPAKVVSARTAGHWKRAESHASRPKENADRRQTETATEGQYHPYLGSKHKQKRRTRSPGPPDFGLEEYERSWPSAGRTVPTGRISKTTRVQRDAVEALLEGAKEAFRPVQKEVRGRRGTKTKWVMNAANVSR
ncbi:hypothetical protein B0T14DRAFT_148120 [Immersiella caudata]|uniref:Azaphilone pigments biosynthesis cluster protein L N-terminal domain-containing protein n=1 Tax=Immersiella caudata TaxID=314043 RepID=A0AA39WVM4_9PEZI|nr:hypothetical protein B0T14DRAFT_148120 [Immersiella caudata]